MHSASNPWCVCVLGRAISPKPGTVIENTCLKTLVIGFSLHQPVVSLPTSFVSVTFKIHVYDHQTL